MEKVTTPDVYSEEPNEEDEVLLYSSHDTPEQAAARAERVAHLFDSEDDDE